MLRTRFVVFASVLAVGAMSIATATASAQSSRPAADGRSEEVANRAWDPSWPRFRWWEYVGTGVLAAEAATVRFGLEWKTDGNWTSGLPGDDWVLEQVRTDDDDTYHRWVLTGDVPFYASMGWAAVDPVLSGAASGDWTAAGQMTLMNLEAYAVYASVLWTTQYFVRRERPQADRCSDPRIADQRGVTCDEADRYRSFLGGHTGVVTTSAALTCLHHTQMDLYGEAGDAVACGAWIAAAGVTFASRTVTAKHYPSDNLFGVGLGLLAGWLVPYALHYGQDTGTGEEHESVAEPEPTVTGASLSPTRAGATVGLTGIF